MALLQEIANVRPQGRERRWFQRVRVNLLGRFILPDRREFPCQVQDMSPGGVALVAPVSGRVGERVIVYVDQLGRLEGTIARINATGFALTFAATPRKRDKLAAQLTWLANRCLLNLPQERKHERVVPRKAHATLVLPAGSSVSCQVVQLSQSGAAVRSHVKPPVDSMVRLGNIEGRVVRISDDGFAVEFVTLLDPESFEEEVTDTQRSHTPSQNTRR
jgi:hypothetical protein